MFCTTFHFAYSHLHWYDCIQYGIFSERYQMYFLESYILVKDFINCFICGLLFQESQVYKKQEKN